MTIYNLGGVHDYLQDIHFPHAGVKFNPNVSKPWYYWLLPAQPLEFSYLAGVWGDGWAARDIFGVIKILAVDTQPMVKLPRVGNASLEGAADRVVEQWDKHDPLDPEFFGRFNFSDKFFWKVLGEEFPKWATNLSTTPTSRPGEAHGPIEPYITKNVKKFMAMWNSDSQAYTAQSVAVSSIGFGGGALMSGFADGWPVKHDHSFAVPFPSQEWTFKQIADAIDERRAWFGPIPPTANDPEFLILTAASAFSYGLGQFDDNEWDLSHWPPRRTSIPQREGGSPRQPSAITKNYKGLDPSRNFLNSQPDFAPDTSNA